MAENTNAKRLANDKLDPEDVVFCEFLKAIGFGQNPVDGKPQAADEDDEPHVGNTTLSPVAAGEAEREWVLFTCPLCNVGRYWIKSVIDKMTKDMIQCDHCGKYHWMPNLLALSKELGVFRTIDDPQHCKQLDKRHRIEELERALERERAK